MNRFTKAALGLALLAGGTLQAGAFELVSPQEGEVNEVAMLDKLTLVWDEMVNEYPDKNVTVLDASGAEVSVGNPDFDWDNYSAYAVAFNPILVDPGTYTVVVPANMALDNDNREYRLTYQVAGASGPAAEPTSFDPENGSTITQSEEVAFSKIRIDFANDPSIEVNKDLIFFTNEKGMVPYTLFGFYSASDPMLQIAPNPFVVIEFNENGDMPSGEYRLVCKPGAFTSPLGVYEKEITLVYKYTKTKADADDTPLEITSALMGKVKGTAEWGMGYVDLQWIGEGAVDVTPDMKIAEFEGMNNSEESIGTAFLLNFNHGEKAGYVTYELLDLDAKEILTSSECKKQEDGSFLLAWASTVKLYENTHYALEFRTYNNIQDKVEFGDGARLTFIGTTEPYKYSSAQFVTAVPSPGTIISEYKYNKVTVLFTEPVAATANYSIGMGAGTETMECVSSNEEAYDNVWYIYIPRSVMNGYPEVEINVVAYGKDGYIVADGKDLEDLSRNVLSYQLSLCQPRIMLGQTNNHVPEINIFSAYSSKGNGINTTWLAYPYVVNAAGETVAQLNKEYCPEGEYKVLKWSSASQWDADPLELEFQFVPAITEKGKYSIIFPAATFNFGTQFDGETSVEQQYDFYVVDYFPVTYTVDSNSVALSDVEFGKSVELGMEAADGWKLESLTLNGEDVTENVSGGRYLSPAAEGAMAFVATFAYDGIVATPESGVDVVTDLNLRGWSEEGSLYVAGLKEGQNVEVFSAGGSRMGSYVIGADDTLKISVPEGVYIITVADGTQKVALKLMNK